MSAVADGRGARGRRRAARTARDRLGRWRARRRRRDTGSRAEAAPRATSGISCSPRCTRCSRGVGWISEGGLNYVCQRLTVPPAEAYGVATFYAMFSVEPRPRTVVHVCDDLACRLDGDALCAELERTAGPPNGRGRRRRLLGAQPVPRHVRTRPGGPGPARRAAREDDAFGHATATQVRSLLTDASHEPEFARPNDPAVASAPQTWDADGRGPACGCCGASASSDPSSIDDYRAHGGYEALRRAHRARAGGHDPRDHRREADGPRRRGVPDRGEVEGGRRAARAPALLHLQRRRIRARHVQGPGRDGAGPVRGRRGAHDRRVRHGVRAGLHLHPRRVPAGDGPPGARDRRGAPARVPGRRRDGARVRVRHRAPARRRRVHLRRGDRAVQLDRGQARRTAEQAAVPGAARACSASRRGSTTSRR